MWKIIKQNDKIYCYPFKNDDIYRPFLNFRICNVGIEEIYPVGYFASFFYPSVAETKQVKLTSEQVSIFKKLDNKIYSEEESEKIINSNISVKNMFSEYLQNVQRKLIIYILS